MSVTEATLEKKFLSVTNTQDSIQTLSLWLLHYKVHYKKIIDTWIKVLKKDKIGHRLTLFYLANDVIQNCKRKNILFFKDSFKEALKNAMTCLRDEQIKPSVERVFKIWEERSVYESVFISELQKLLNEDENENSEEAKIIREFKVGKVVEKIKLIRKLDMEIVNKTATVNFSKLENAKTDILQLKDRTSGERFIHDYDKNVSCMEEVIKSITKLQDERNKLITVIGDSLFYYESQKAEVKVVANAYKNFASRVKVIEKKLKEIMETFESPPPPSPTSDAPSPTTSDAEAELNLPCEQNNEKPDVEQSLPSVSSSVAQSASTPTEVGNPIPTVSNVFGQEPAGMTSWLDTFGKEEPPAMVPPVVNSTSQNNSISLDSRLSSLLQNIPTLSSGLPNTLFNSNLPLSMPESNTNSPAINDKNACVNAFQPAEVLTPTKEDDYSGQNTPLQDEDTPSIPSFFTGLVPVPKTSQSPKQILKGLKNFIQNASSSMSSEKSLSHDESLPWSLNKTEMSVKQNTVNSDKTVSHFAEVSRNLTSASVYQSPQQHNTSADTISVMTSAISTCSSQTSFSNAPLYTSKTYFPETAISQNINKNLSFIPTLVPSTPTATNFNFPPEDTYCPYSPTHENFETDMDIDSNCGDNSPDASVGTPDITEDKMDERVNVPRPSALITLITDNKVAVTKENESIFPFPEPKRNFSGIKDFLSTSEKNTGSSTTEVVPFLESSQVPTSDKLPFSTSSFVTSSDYAAPIKSTYAQSMWPLTSPQQTSQLLSPLEDIQKSVIPPVSCQDEESLNETYFLTSPPPPPSETENDFLNGQAKMDTDLRILPPYTEVSATPAPLKIETIDSNRVQEEDRWETDDWSNFEYTEDRHHEQKQFRGSHRRGDYNRQFDGPRQRFPPRNRPYGPRPGMNFQRGPPPRLYRPLLPPPQFSQREGSWNRHSRPRY